MKHCALLPLLLLPLLLLSLAATTAKVDFRRLPDDAGIEPQVAVDPSGGVHLIYFKGDPKAGDVYYARSSDGGETFSSPIRANSEPASALIIGSVRGPRLAIGRDNRAHVTWSGAVGGMPLLYARLADDGKSFEPPRVLLKKGLDGGASVAADDCGNVYVVYHAPAGKEEGEQHRRVFVTRSRDDGKTFASATSADLPEIGACACCALHAFVTPSDRTLRVVYRSADKMINRDMYLLSFDDKLDHADVRQLSQLKIGKCVMSTASSSNSFIAWEANNAIAMMDTAAENQKPHTFRGGENMKHPAVAVAGDRVLLVWTEGTGWNKGGKLRCEVFDRRDGHRIDASHAYADDLPAWGTPAAFARPDGSFVVLY